MKVCALFLAAIMVVGACSGSTISTPAAGLGTTVIEGLTTATANASLPGVVEAAPPLATIRASHSATLLDDGRILVVGGYRGDGANATAELRDPSTGTFSATGLLADARYFHAATLLQDGRVLIVGGSADDHSALASAEIWDPVTGRFGDGGSLRVARMFPTATLLPDGRVLMVGGLSTSGTAIAEAELWDPTTNEVVPAGTLGHPRAWHDAMLLPDGRVLIVNGAAQAEIWDPADRRFSDAGTLHEARWWGGSALLQDGRVVVIGGLKGEGFVPGEVEAVGSAEVWDPTTSTFSMAGALREVRGLHSVTPLSDGHVLIIGGTTCGGCSGLSPLASAELWDPATSSFSPATPIAEGRASHTATLVPDGRIVVIGGADAKGRGLASTETWEPTDSAP